MLFSLINTTLIIEKVTQLLKKRGYIVQKIFEPILHIVYLFIIIMLSRYFIVNSLGKRYYKIFASLSLLFGLADVFYLIPRMYAILTSGIADNIRAIGWGRMGYTILITLFYMVLYDAYNVRFNKRKNKGLDKTIYGLGIVRILISLLPGNNWFQLVSSSGFAILRFVPLLLMGILLSIITYIHGKKYEDRGYKLISLMIILSILFIEPIAIVAEKPTAIIIFTIIRTISIMSILLIEYRNLRNITVLSRY